MVNEMNLKTEIWSLIFMDLQKKCDSNAHDSGWMLVICKHWNWNWHWDWKCYIFLTKGGDILLVTAYVKFYVLLITWSCDKCKALHLPFGNTWVVTYNRRTSPSKSYELLNMWSRDKWEQLIFALLQYLWTPNLTEW